MAVDTVAADKTVTADIAAVDKTVAADTAAVNVGAYMSNAMNTTLHALVHSSAYDEAVVENFLYSNSSRPLTLIFFFLSLAAPWPCC